MSEPQKFDARTVNAIYPVVAAEVYANGSICLIRADNRKGQTNAPKRGNIRELSRKSRLRMALVAKETRVEFESLITLTYGQNYPLSGKAVKADLRKMLNRLTYWRGKFDYLWFLEFQKRGAPHVHILVDIPEPRDDKEREYFSRLWVDEVQDSQDALHTRLKDRTVQNDRENMLWFHQRTKQWENLRSVDGAARYALSYATKPHQKTVPEMYQDVGRFWGHSKRTGRLKSTRVVMTSGDVRRIIQRTRPEIASWEILPRLIFDAI